MNIKATAPHLYPAAGIKINTPGYTAANSGVDCQLLNNGYCAFAMSNTVGATIHITPTTVASPSILFVVNTLVQGNFNANNGADTFCAAAASQNALFNANNYIYKALIVTSTRYPCSYLNGTAGCGGDYASSDWPLPALCLQELLLIQQSPLL